MLSWQPLVEQIRLDANDLIAVKIAFDSFATVTGSELEA